MLKIALFVTLLVGAVSCYPGTSRIVNGTAVTQEGKYPFIVSLRRTSHSCGASIINEEWVLTAAHCVQKVRPDQLSIQYGVNDISTSSAANIVGVSQIINHEGYAPAMNYVNDIAVLKLAQKIKFSKTVAPVKLPAFRAKQPEAATLIGWGLDKSGGKVQNILQEVGLKVYSDSECNSRHTGMTAISNVCAGVDEGGKGQCSGDSGGPLVDKDNTQIGIVSWSVKPCTIAGYPGVFTKVSRYVDWIQANIQ